MKQYAPVSMAVFLLLGDYVYYFTGTLRNFQVTNRSCGMDWENGRVF